MQSRVAFFVQTFSVVVHASVAFVLVVIFVTVIGTRARVSERLRRAAERLFPFLDFLVLLVAGLALVLSVLLDVGRPALA
jgi:hypothetical protein